MANDRFGERIMILNKEKVCSSANAKSNEFFRETVTLNILSLWSFKKVVVQATGATSHGNCHFFIVKLPDVSLLVKLMINDSTFEEKLGCTGIPNTTLISAFPDLFYIGSVHLSNSIVLSRYIVSAQDN